MTWHTPSPYSAAATRNAMISDSLGLVPRLARLYTFNTPVARGKFRIALASLKFAGELPELVTARTSDGRELVVDPADTFSQLIYFLGEYEKPITDLVRTLVRTGDVCLDIGANLGWYTTLLQTIVGKAGSVHSFEPVPSTFELLETNVGRNVNLGIVRANRLALGSEEGTVTLHLFEGQPSGHASVSGDAGEVAVEHDCKKTTVDSYLLSAGRPHVDFVKMDVEGSELEALQGAASLFAQEVPPIFVIEMALETSRGFGYLPDDLIRFISSKREYDFYAIGGKGDLTKIEGFAEDDPGANVLCIPRGHYAERMSLRGNS